MRSEKNTQQKQQNTHVLELNRDSDAHPLQTFKTVAPTYHEFACLVACHYKIIVYLYHINSLLRHHGSVH